MSTQPDLTVLDDIEAAVDDYRRIFPEPCALAPNLDLAVRAKAELQNLSGIAALLETVETRAPRDIDGQLYTIPFAQDIVRAVYRIPLGYLAQHDHLIILQTLTAAARAAEQDPDLPGGPALAAWLRNRAETERTS